MKRIGILTSHLATPDDLTMRAIHAVLGHRRGGHGVCVRLHVQLMMRLRDGIANPQARLAPDPVDKSVLQAVERGSTSASPMWRV